MDLLAPGEHQFHGHTALKLSVSVGSMPTDACRDIVEGVQAFGQNLVKKRHKQVPSEAEYTRHCEIADTSSTVLRAESPQ